MAEDGLGDTIRPRLEAAGADLTRVWAFTGIPTPEGGERLPMLPEDGDAIREAVEKHAARMLILDPLFAYVSGEINIFKDGDMRRALQPLVRIGEELGCTSLVLRHLNKAPGGKAIYRGGGSIGIIGAARAGLLVAEDPDDETRRVLAVVKCNLGPKAPAIAYRLVPAMDVTRVAWEGVTKHTARQLLAGPGEDGAGTEAETFLRDVLAAGPVASQDVKKQGVFERTLWRAKAALGIRATRHGFGGAGGWFWELPAIDCQEDQSLPKPATFERRQPMAAIGEEDGHLQAPSPAAPSTPRPDLFRWNGLDYPAGAVLPDGRIVTFEDGIPILVKPRPAEQPEVRL